MKRLHKTFGVVVGSALAAMSLASCGDNGVNCGEGTVEKDGSCVPDGTKICTGSLSFDPATGTCALDPSACKDGTVLVDGSCQDSGVVKVDATESAEPNDDATPAGTITVPAIGAKGFVIKGCITPYRDVETDANDQVVGDGILDADLDQWVVTVTQPTVLDVNADGVRGLVAGFVMVSADAELTELGYVRQAVSITNDRAAREIYLPKAGTYALFMADSRTILNPGVGPGDVNTCYYATITQKALPTAKTIALQPLNSSYEGKVELYNYVPTEGEVFTINAIPKSAGNQTGLTVVKNDAFARLANGDANDATAFAFVTNMKAADTIKVVYDPALVFSGAPVGYQLQARPILATALPTNGDLPLMNKLPNAGVAVDVFDLNWTYMDVAAANEIKHIKVSSGSKFNWAILDADTLVAAGTGTVNGLNAAGMAAPMTSRAGDADWFRFPKAGRYYVLFHSPGTAGNYTINAVQTVATRTTFAVGTPATAVALGSAARNSAFGDITTNENWSLTSASSANFTGQIQVSRYLKTAAGRFDRDFVNIASSRFLKDGTTNVGEIINPGLDGQVIRISDVSTPATDTSLFNLSLTRRDYTDLDTVIEGTPLVSAAAAIPAGGTKRYFVKAKKGSLVNIVATPAGGANIQVSALAANEATVTRVGLGGANNPRTLNASSLNGWVAIVVVNNGPAGMVSLTLNSQAPATFSDACVGGSVLPQTPDATEFGGIGDEAFSATQTLPFNFSLFGQTVTDFKVSSNGWLSFEPGLSNDDAQYAGQSFDTTRLLRGGIGAYWADLAGIVICKKEDATKVTIQWTGATLGGLFTPGIKVQAQAILYKDQPRIDFVYGPTGKHDNTGADASIGINSLSLDRSFVIGFKQPVASAGSGYVVPTN
jgi:hypothetical protein